VLLADRYQLDEMLGRGAMGEVWRAADHVLGRSVAVKVLHGDDAAGLERFRLEAQTAGSLSHPNVVGVYDFGSHQGRPYLVMELVDGWNLSQERALRGVLDPCEASGIAAQMAAGLAAAHRQGVVHRDIKPANVMLTAERTVKITDFGIARFADDAAGTMTATGKIVGSAAYLAPERALGRPAQRASDVYSLGCVLYELLTGHPPFRGTTSVAVVQQHVDDPPPPPRQLSPRIPQPLEDYVLHLLAKDPDHRPSADQAAAWLHARQQPEVPPEPDDPAPPPPSAAPATEPHRAMAGHAARVRPRGGRGPGTKTVLGVAGVALFAGAVAIGASLDSGHDSPASPASPPPATAPPVTSGDTPTAEPTPDDPTTASAPRDDHGHKGRHGEGRGRGKGSDD
jgi:eukaryotic-like serine/threonine-protein kinase